MKEHNPIVPLSQQLSFELIAVLDPIDEITISYRENSDGTFDLALSPRQMSIAYRLIYAHSADTYSKLTVYHGSTAETVGAESIGPETAAYLFSSTLVRAQIKEDSSFAKALVDITKPLISDGVFFVFPRTRFDRPAFIGFTSTTTPAVPLGLRLESQIYDLSVSTATSSASIPLTVKIGYTKGAVMSRSWYSYDPIKGWQKIKSYNHVKNSTVEANIDVPFKSIALMAEEGAHDGIASWYSFRNCLCAASTVYPKGTLLKVTRLKTGSEVIVKVNDYGPEVTTGRILDLDKKAFKKIGSLGAGIIYVRVEPYTKL